MYTDYISIGITGTVGKTSTCLLLHSYLLNKHYKVITFTTAGIYFNTKCMLNDFPQTTFVDKEKLLEFIDKEKPNYVILELTAEANKFYATDELHIMALTTFKNNVVQTFSSNDEYLQNKLNLFNTTKSIYKVLNNNCKEFTNNILSERGIITFGDTNSDIYIVDSKIEKLKLCIKLNIYDKWIKTNLLSDINKDNILCFISILKVLNKLDFKILKLVLSNINLPGRLEHYEISGRNIIIDSGYNGINGLFPVIQKLKYKNIISVVCTYNFDETKKNILTTLYRYQKGLFYNNISSLCIFTKYGKNKGDEKLVLKELTKYLIKNYKIIEDRYDAIKYAWKHSKKGDYILLIGKGNEFNPNHMTDYQILLDVINTTE